MFSETAMIKKCYYDYVFLRFNILITMVINIYNSLFNNLYFIQFFKYLSQEISND